VQAICERSLADLAALRFEIEADGHKLSAPAAGVPWYLAIIGRDTLWTGYQALPFVPDLAEGALRALAGLHAMEGRFARAWEYVERDRSILRELGLRVVVSASAEIGGLVGLLAGDPARAEAELRWGYELLEEMGDRSGLATVAAVLADAVLAQGRDEEALRFSEQSEDAAAPEDLSAQVQWRSARAKVLARAGKTEQGESLAREAVRLAAQTDFLVLHGDALVDLAEVVGLAERGRERLPLLEEAVRLYEQKGNVVAAERARSRISAERGSRLKSRGRG
jgi:hypothetical protein